jgi:rhodanese-related sulfurtransferase/DNA-binding transcriptional ArsR family regulator
MDADRAAKTALNEQFARVAQALASPRRIELLDLLAQGERSVEALAGAADMTLALASSHLQVLRAARLVERRRDGARVRYRLSGDDVYRLLAALRGVARARVAEVEQLVGTYLAARDHLEPVSRDELAAKVASGEAIVLDVRPREEYEAGHVAGARSIPLAELEARLAELPADQEIIAYCRGPYCVFAPSAVELLRRQGYHARRLVDGFPGWRLAGLPVASGAADRMS